MVIQLRTSSQATPNGNRICYGLEEAVHQKSVTGNILEAEGKAKGASEIQSSDERSWSKDNYNQDTPKSCTLQKSVKRGERV